MAADKNYKHDLRRDIFSLKKGETVLSTWPELAEYPDLVKYGSEKNDALLRYCILLTDPGSGYLTIANIELRHQKAWAAVGLPANDPRQEKAFDFTDEGVAAMSYALLESEDSMMLAYVLGAEAILWKELRKLRTSTELDSDALDGLPAQIRNVNAEKKNLFAGDKGLETAVKVVAAKSTQGTAEQMARETVKRV